MENYNHLEEEQQGRRKDQLEFCSDATAFSIIGITLFIMVIILIKIW